MQFRQINDSVIVKGGTWIAYTLTPDRGEGPVIVRSVDVETEYQVARCGRPAPRWMTEGVPYSGE